MWGGLSDSPACLKDGHHAAESIHVNGWIILKGHQVGYFSRLDSADGVCHANGLSRDAGGGQECLSWRKADPDQELQIVVQVPEGEIGDP